MQYTSHLGHPHRSHLHHHPLHSQPPPGAYARAHHWRSPRNRDSTAPRLITIAGTTQDVRLPLVPYSPLANSRPVFSCFGQRFALIAATVSQTHCRISPLTSDSSRLTTSRDACGTRPSLATRSFTGDSPAFRQAAVVTFPTTQPISLPPRARPRRVTGRSNFTPAFPLCEPPSLRTR